MRAEDKVNLILIPDSEHFAGQSTMPPPSTSAQLVLLAVTTLLVGAARVQGSAAPTGDISTLKNVDGNVEFRLANSSGYVQVPRLRVAGTGSGGGDSPPPLSIAFDAARNTYRIGSAVPVEVNGVNVTSLEERLAAAEAALQGVLAGRVGDGFYIPVCAAGCKRCNDSGTCLECYPGYFKGGSSGPCTKCDPPCLTCAGDAADCTSCADPRYLNRPISRCVPFAGCGDSTYGDDNTRVCEDCNFRCHLCTGPSQHSCTECTSNYFLAPNGTSCVDAGQCPPGYTEDDPLDRCV